jgi:beta-phosphoglucomutase family hydrolase
MSQPDRHDGKQDLTAWIGEVDAFIFDMDGVVTDTARVHARCWKHVFDQYLRDLSTRTGEPFLEFTNDDYLCYVDGKPRYDGAACFILSRGGDLRRGTPSDPPGYDSICAIANLKDREFERIVTGEGVTTFPSTLAFVHSLRSRGFRTALISSSRHAKLMLTAAGITDLFDVVVDGVESEVLELPGKPDPAIFLTAARLLGVAPSRSAVVEDAMAGVEAGHRGGFGLVVGVDRVSHAEALRDCGADLVVKDLFELTLPAPSKERR